MGKLKALKAKYEKGEINKKQYDEELKKLLEGEFIEQDTYDEALAYNPDDDKPIYTQAEVDGIVLKKATKMTRKALKEAGVEIDADDKSLMGKVTELVKIGMGKIKPPDGEGLEALKKDAEKGKTLEGSLRAVRTENAVLKQVYKYNPHSVAQVVRALNSDYSNLLEVDDSTGEVDTGSIDRAIKKLQKEEPNLFKAAGEDQGNLEGQGNNQGNSFRGKAPGGGMVNSKDATFEAKKAAALEMIDSVPKK